MKRFKRIIKLIFAPFMDKYKLQMRLNSSEIRRAELEEMFNRNFTMRFLKAIQNEDEVQRLTKENHRLRMKINRLKKDLRGEK